MPSLIHNVLWLGLLAVLLASAAPVPQVDCPWCSTIPLALVNHPFGHPMFIGPFNQPPHVWGKHRVTRKWVARVFREPSGLKRAVHVLVTNFDPYPHVRVR